ncbi:hypothetical protein [Priestia abyssalis]|uniref:hypothetical protein n=1 Tax=Priestia abyssalis TaxID=1221450 RepID=UPI00099543FE|nr:hypothetical protein [Priestia abyssalis]
MLIIGTFEHSIELEQALAILEHSGISRDHILVSFMDSEPTSPSHLMSKSHDVRSKGFEVGISFATGSAVIGASVGFILTWGPIIWGLIASFIGFGIGFGLYYIIKKGNRRSHFAKKLPEVTIVIQCTEDHSNHIKEIMWNYRALTVGQVLQPSLQHGEMTVK